MTEEEKRLLKNAKAREKYLLNIEKERDRAKNKNKEQRKEYYQKNKEKIKEKYQNNIDENREKAKLFYLENIEKSKEYYQNNKEIILESNKRYREVNPNYDSEYYKKNKEYISKRNYEYQKQRKASDSLYKLTCDIRRTIGDSFRNNGYSKTTKTHEILGCSFEELKNHLETKFESWMTWENKGNPKDGVFELNKTWDVDHIIPLDTAITEEDIIRLNHHTNLQPLCSYYNRWVKVNKL